MKKVLGIMSAVVVLTACGGGEKRRNNECNSNH